MDAAKLVLMLTGSSAGAVTAIQEVNGSLDSLQAKSDESGSKLAKIGTMAAVAVAAAAVAVGVSAVDMAVKYQSSTADMQNAAGITAAAAKSIGDAFLTTGGQSAFSAEQMMEAFAPVAGQLKEINGQALTTAQSLSFMQAATNLATASGEDLTTTTATLAKTMQAYQVPVSDASETTDQLYNTARATGLGLDSLAQMLQRTRTSAGALSPSLGDMNTLLLDLTNNGETGRGAVSILSTALSGMITPTKAVADEQKKMGFSAIDAAGNFKSMRDIIAEVNPMIAGMGNEQAIATLKSLGFAGADKKLVDTIDAGTASWDKAAKQVNAQGTAASDATNKNNTFAGTIARLKGAFEDTMTSLGQKLLPTLQSFANWFVANEPQIMGFVSGAIMGLVSALTTVAGVLTTVLTPPIKFFSDNISWLGPILASVVASLILFKTAMMIQALIEGVSGGIATLAAMTNILTGSEFAAAGGADALAVSEGLALLPILAIVAGIAAVIAIGYELITHWNTVKQIAAAVWNGIKTIIGDVVNWIVAQFNYFKAGAIAVFDDIAGAVSDAVGVIGDIWSVIVDILNVPFQIAWVLIEIALGLISTAVILTLTVINIAWKVVTTILSVPVHLAVVLIQAIFNVLTAIVRTTISVLTTIWNVVTTILSVPVKAAVTLIQDYINLVIGIVKTVLSAVGDVWNAVTGVISGPIQAGVNIGKTIFGGIISFFQGAISTVAGVFGHIGDAISGAFKTAFNFVANLWNKTLGQIGFTVPGWIPGIGGDSWHIPHIPTFAEGSGWLTTPQIAQIGDNSRGERVQTKDQYDKEMAAMQGSGDVHIYNPASNVDVIQSLNRQRWLQSLGNRNIGPPASWPKAGAMG